MDALRVQHLAGYGLEVPDLTVARDFYTAFGLSAQLQGDKLQLRSASTGPADIVMLKGAHKRLHHLSFAINEGDVERFSERLKAAGCPAVTPPFGAIRGRAVVSRIRAAPGSISRRSRRSRPCSSSNRCSCRPVSIATSGRNCRARDPAQQAGAPLDLHPPTTERTEAFFCDVLGLRVADRAFGKASFLAAGSGIRDHHCFGLIPSTHRGFQHSSFHVDSVDAIGFGAMQMRKAGYTEGFGLGRHALASNLFYYTRDPWGSWVEYYSDMDKISEAWQSRDWRELPYIWPGLGTGVLVQGNERQSGTPVARP